MCREASCQQTIFFGRLELSILIQSLFGSNRLHGEIRWKCNATGRSAPAVINAPLPMMSRSFVESRTWQAGFWTAVDRDGVVYWFCESTTRPGEVQNTADSLLPGNLVAMVPNALIPMVRSILDTVHRAARQGFFLWQPRAIQGPNRSIASWFIISFFIISIAAHCDRRHLTNLKKDQHLHHAIHRATFTSRS